MGDMADDFRAMRDHQRTVKSKRQPQRMAYAIKKLKEAGYWPVEIDTTQLQVEAKDGSTVRFWPYSGWFSGTSVKDGRGIENLLEQLN
jgi:hypothetical protein